MFQSLAVIISHLPWVLTGFLVLTIVFLVGCSVGYRLAIAIVDDLQAARLAAELSNKVIFQRLLRQCTETWNSFSVALVGKYHAGRSAIAWAWWLTSDGAFWLAIPTLTASIRFVVAPLMSLVRWSKRVVR